MMPWIEQKRSLLKALLQSDTAKLCAVIVLSLLLLRTFFTNHFIGGVDASMYARYLKDSIIQTRAGYFPVQVGQSNFNVLGVAYMQAPYYFNFGAVLDLLTFGALSPLAVQHLTVILSVSGGALAMYHCLKQLFPELGWHLVGLAVLFVYCPGLIGVIYMYDMYWSITSIPYIPFLFYGLIRLERQGDFPASAAIGASLAVIWACHAPIALWGTTLAFIYVVLFLIFNARNKSQWVYAVLPFLLFPLLDCWHLSSVFMMGLQNMNHHKEPFFVDSQFVSELLEQLHSVLPAALLPVQEGTRTIDNLQLGYALWYLALAAGILALKQTIWRKDGDKGLSATTLLFVCFGFMTVLLFPIPKVTESLWSSAPHVFSITRIWPMERFYIILSAMACFMGAYFLSSISTFSFKYRGLFVAGTVIFYGWAFIEGSKLTTSGKLTTSKEIEPPHLWVENADNEAIWTGFDIAKFPDDVHDLALENTLFDPATRMQIESNRPGDKPGFTREQIPTLKPEYVLKASSSTPEVGAAFNVLLRAGRRYAFVYDFVNEGFDGFLFLRTDTTYLRKYRTFLLQNVLTAWNPAATDLNVRWIIVGNSKKEGQPATLTLRNLRVYSYTPESLPISIKSFTPYVADVDVKLPAYLETNKCYYPGYSAVVNGKEIDVMSSPRGMATILLPPGANHIVLEYRGTLINWLAFCLNGVAWIALAYAVRRSIKAEKRNGGNERLPFRPRQIGGAEGTG